MKSGQPIPDKLKVIPSGAEQRRWLYIAVCGSFLLTLLLSKLDGVINLDGVTYIRAAYLFEREGLDASVRYFPWPFYSILISTVSTLTGFEHEISAHLLNAMLMSVLAYGFLILYQEIYPQRVNLWAPCILFLLFHELNDYRDYVIRDFGYWAFIVLSLGFLLRYLRTNESKHAFLWQLFVIIAFLFRLEALAIVLSVIFYLLVDRNEHKRFLRVCWQLNWMLFAGGAVVAGALVVGGLSSGDIRLQRLLHIFEFVSPSNYFSAWNSHVELFAQSVLPSKDIDDARAVLFVGTIGFVVLTILKKIHVLGVAGLVCMMNRPSLVSDGRHRLLFMVLLVQVAMLAVFYQKNLLLQGRYAIFAAIVLMVPVAAIYDRYVPMMLANKRMVLGALFALLAVYSTAKSFSVGSGKQYIVEFGRDSGELFPADSQVVTNSLQLHHYSRYRLQLTRDLERWLQSKNNVDGADYLVVILDEKDMNISNLLVRAGFVEQSRIRAEGQDSIVILSKQ